MPCTIQPLRLWPDWLFGGRQLQTPKIPIKTYIYLMYQSNWRVLGVSVDTLSVYVTSFGNLLFCARFLFPREYLLAWGLASRSGTSRYMYCAEWKTLSKLLALLHIYHVTVAMGIRPSRRSRKELPINWLTSNTRLIDDHRWVSKRKFALARYLNW